MATTVDHQAQACHPAAAGRSGRLRNVVIAVPLGVLLAGGLGSVVERRCLLLAGAMLLGWSQLVGPWGESLFGALVPLGKVAKAKAQWLGTVVLYTLAGAVTSMLAGVALGGVGGWLPRGRLDAVGVPAMLGIAVLAACRELGWVRFSVPQPHRQTKDLWAKSFSPPVAATLWGLDLGLTVTTRFTFSGVWVLVLLPVLLADAGLGAVLLLAYWLGRALPVWLGPLLLDDAASAPCVLDGVGDHYRVFQRIHVLGLVVIFIALLVL